VTLLPSNPLGLSDSDALQSDLLSASFTSSSLNGLMMASIFFTLSASRTFPELEKRDGSMRVAQSVRSYKSGASRRNVADHGHLGWPSERLPQKQGLCQVANAPDFGVLSDF
jgi:hypothetical protein